MINLLSFNTRSKFKKIYNYQHFFVFNRIKDFLSSNKPKDKLIITEKETNEYQKSKKTVIEINEEPQKFEKSKKYDKTILKKGKKKETRELSEVERAKKGGVFTSSFKMKKEKKLDISQVKASITIFTSLYILIYLNFSI